MWKNKVYSLLWNFLLIFSLESLAFDDGFDSMKVFYTQIPLISPHLLKNENQNSITFNEYLSDRKVLQYALNSQWQWEEHSNYVQFVDTLLVEPTEQYAERKSWTWAKKLAKIFLSKLSYTSHNSKIEDPCRLELFVDDKPINFLNFTPMYRYSQTNRLYGGRLAIRSESYNLNKQITRWKVLCTSFDNEYELMSGNYFFLVFDYFSIKNNPTLQNQVNKDQIFMLISLN